MTEEAKTSAGKKYMSLREFFQPENFYGFCSPMGRTAVEVAEDLKEIREKTSSYINNPNASKEEIAQYFFFRGLDYATSDILRYLSSELQHESHENPLERFSIATLSENRFTNAGIVALSALLTYHQATHYAIGCMFSELTIESTDEDFKAYSEKHCNAVPKILKLLAENFPEMLAQRPAPTVN